MTGAELLCSWVQILTVLVVGFISISQAENESGLCRFASGQYYKPDLFKNIACCRCYETLFQSIATVGVGYCNWTSLTIGDVNDRSVSIPLDPYNTDNVDRICDLVGNDNKCEWWTQCCKDAVECCDMMKNEPVVDNTELSDNDLESSAHCPASWDMFHCWKRAEPSTQPTAACPDYLVSGSLECVDPAIHYASRDCMPNGVWNPNMSTYLGESDYKRCAKSHDCFLPLLEAKHKIEIICESISLLAVVPATIIFFVYKNLLSQQRIRIHINLFISLIMYDVLHMAYELTVKHHEIVEDVFNDNPVECRALNALTKFATLAVFLWMSMEAFYLHWLMFFTFHHQPRFLLLALFGWGIPAFITSVYVISKATNSQANLGCWFVSDALDWIIHAPLIVCLLLNLVFLVNIQRIILTQLTVHQNEPSFYRRAVKATAILVPPFGLFLILTLYSPNGEDNYKAKLIYDCVVTAVQHLQGLAIAMTLCYTNGEVLGNLKKTLRYYVPHSDDSRLPETSLTAVSHMSARRTSSFNTESNNTATTPINNHEMRLLVKQPVSNGFDEHSSPSYYENNNELLVKKSDTDEINDCQ